jgi:murein DD-endopeptidase MepM/ murein hydrolase activator NlpD
MNGTGSAIDVLKPPTGSEPVSAGEQPRSPEQLRVLAAQFESMLLSQMLSQMRSSMFDDEQGDSGFASGPLGDAMYSELSLALSRAGGFGLADSMMAPLMREAGETMPGTSGTLGMPAPTPVTMPEMTGPAMRSALFEGTLTSSFGWRQHPVSGGMKFHKGVDIAMPVGRDVPAARAGQVTFAGEQGGYGLTVIVNHGDGVSTRYAHLSEIKVKAGDSVGDGQSIARSGATGRVTGAHLHFEVLDNGQPIDPAAGVGRLYATK